ncbi:replication initiation protein [Sulfuricurvum sp. RIFCSPLOWO2_12_FULL_43_24]|uniref:replication initiation protein n=1 Tax=Sulfuricurvum sp. RIFCSPLOWO2_12_FULL_43_24 TaxID=1802247 RepID=UPI0025EA7D63|nr:replication initiation protein [Sulfuricurvum sp. RIFCSPLOWO2_12_FULL_43_24]
MEYVCKKPHKYSQIQLNTDTHFNAIIMDVDDEEMLTEWNAVGLPVPTIQTINLNNKKAHLVWLLNVPISKRNKKAVRYYRDIVKSIQILIGADRNYQNHQTKNFLNIHLYHTVYNDYAYDLSEFRQFILSTVAQDITVEDTERSKSRHITLFNQLRHYGYKIAKNRDFYDLLKAKAEILNHQFEIPINYKSILKSVYEFCHENRNNFKVKATVKTMGFSKIVGLSLEKYQCEVSSRQRKAAKRTTQLKVIQTIRFIKVAIDHLIRKKCKITNTAIAQFTKRSLSTIKRYSGLIRKFIAKKKGLIRSIRVIASGGEERATHLPLRGAPLIALFTG